MEVLPINNLEKLQTLAREFSNSCANPTPLQGCVRALHGIAIEICNPLNKSVPRNSYCRTRQYALPIQAIVDSDYRFKYVSAGCSGSTQDSVAWACSELAIEVPNGGLTDPLWLAGDARYECTGGVLTPWSSAVLHHRNMGLYRDSFDFYHSSLRIHVAQSFAILLSRWGILWRPIRMRIQVEARILAWCMRFHNYDIETSSVATPNLSPFEAE